MPPCERRTGVHRRDRRGTSYGLLVIILKLTSTRSADQALHAPGLSSGTQNNCLKLLYRTCGRHALLPGALRVSVCYDKTSNALYRGGYADVWKGKLHGQDVAIKVIRTSSNDDLRKIINVGRPLSVHHVSMTTFCTEILQRGRDVEIPSTSKCPVADRSIDIGDSVRNGIGVDAKREYQSIYQSTPRSKSSWTRSCSVCNLFSLVLMAEKSPADRCH